MQSTLSSHTSNCDFDERQGHIVHLREVETLSRKLTWCIFPPGNHVRLNFHHHIHAGVEDSHKHQETEEVEELPCDSSQRHDQCADCSQSCVFLDVQPKCNPTPSVLAFSHHT